MSVLTTPELSDLCGRIRRLAETYDNADTTREEVALKAASKGRAAWWSSAQYHNQSAVNVALYANVSGLQTALKMFADDDYPSPARHTANLVASLIPLNPRAEAEKSAFVAADTERRAG